MTDPGIETELKIPVADLAMIRSRLAVLDARLISESKREVNLLLDTRDHELSGRGCVLRLRKYGDLRILTFKGPASYDGPIKVRPEHEVLIEDLEKMQTVLEALGFVGVARYEKDRETWRAGPVEIVLDHTPMGDFVEVEGPSELLESVTRSLGLDPHHAVRGSYMSLWTEFRACNSEMKLPPDMVFGV
ncbi:MAG: class IV adenylate cyclase [Acidobacteriota bacterium]|nr:class IV adenylate cyclase [Acidobacteriota bacterium]